MISINTEIINKARVKGFLKKIEDIFENYYFTCWEDLYDATNLEGVDVLVLRSKICNLFEGEIDFDEMEVLDIYLVSFHWIFKNYNSCSKSLKQSKCKYAMRVKDDILRYIKELALKYGGLE